LVAVIDRRAHSGRQVGGVDDVLDPDGDAGKRPLTCRQAFGTGREGAQVAVALIDSPLAVGKGCLGGNLAIGDAASDIANRKHESVPGICAAEPPMWPCWHRPGA
jgi:hypothetical protein